MKNKVWSHKSRYTEETEFSVFSPLSRKYTRDRGYLFPRPGLLYIWLGMFSIYLTFTEFFKLGARYSSKCLTPINISNQHDVLIIWLLIFSHFSDSGSERLRNWSKNTPLVSGRIRI